MNSCLIVDDSEIIREIISRMVKDLGLEPREAETAGEAVDFCQENKPDVVLLDWDLPSMGALDFLRGAGALEEDKRPTIILCATENDPQQFSLANAAGAKFHLLKPFDQQTLKAELEKAGVLDRDETVTTNVDNVKVIS